MSCKFATFTTQQIEILEKNIRLQSANLTGLFIKFRDKKAKM